VLLGSRDLVRALNASTQAIACSFPTREVDVFFLFGFVYSCFFTVYICNRLILYGLLGSF
jgi:hypothetical protein